MASGARVRAVCAPQGCWRGEGRKSQKSGPCSSWAGSTQVVSSQIPQQVVDAVSHGRVAHQHFQHGASQARAFGKIDLLVI
jgi:hypothetical protein